MTGTLTIASPQAPDPAPRLPASLHAAAGTAGVQAQVERTAPVEAARAIDRDRLESDRLKALVTDPGLRVSIRPDEASGRVVMQVVDRATGQVVEQVPAEELVRLYAALREPLLDERA